MGYLLKASCCYEGYFYISSLVLPGRPLKAIDYERVCHLRKLGLSWVKIAEKLNISRQTLYRHLEGNSSLFGYTDISLDSIISAYVAAHPNDGERMVIGHLRSSNVFVQRSRIRESMHQVDPVGVADRRRTTIKRRVYTMLIIQMRYGIWTATTRLFGGSLSYMVRMMDFPEPSL